MTNFIIIFFCIAAGMIFKATKSIHHEAHKGINTWILYMALPAVSFKYIPKIVWSEDMLMPALSPIIVWIGAFFLTWFYSKRKGYSRRSRSTIELASGFSNTSFIGFPLVAAFYGEQYLSIAIICDQVSFLVLSTAGIVTALKGGASNNKGGDKHISIQFILKRLLKFPPLIGCASALILSSLFDLSFAEPFFDKLAATVGPLALFSVGLQLKFKGLRSQIGQVTTSMFYKLILAPLLVLCVGLLLGLRGIYLKIAIIEAAMPTLITASIIAEEFRLNARLLNLIIGAAIVAGILTSSVWWQLMNFFGW